MLRRHIICLYLCILAAWIQFLAPVAALSMERPTDPLGIVCARGAAQPGHGTPAHRHHQCDCCLLCHAYLGAAPLAERPAFTVFDYPVASPLRWQAARSLSRLSVPRHDSLPRGPPRLV